MRTSMMSFGLLIANPRTSNPQTRFVIVAGANTVIDFMSPILPTFCPDGARDQILNIQYSISNFQFSIYHTRAAPIISANIHQRFAPMGQRSKFSIFNIQFSIIQSSFSISPSRNFHIASYARSPDNIREYAGCGYLSSGAGALYDQGLLHVSVGVKEHNVVLPI